MPTYEYRCAKCGHEFEKFQSMTESALRKCPKCGKLSLRRLIGTGAGIIFKGSGFYETDYRSESYKSAAKKETDTGPKTDTGGKKDTGKKADTGSQSAPKDTKSEAKTGTGSKPKAKPKE